jgi:ethanolamine utilization protein EutQ
MSVQHFSSTEHQLGWYRSEGRQIFLADALDETSDAAMSVGFARYGKGASNPWVVTYDEALIITSGAFSVEWKEGTQTARAGEVLFLSKGTALVYRADEDTELVYVTYPHWSQAQRNSEHADLLDTFHPVDHKTVDAGRSEATPFPQP